MQFTNVLFVFVSMMSVLCFILQKCQNVWLHDYYRPSKINLFFIVFGKNKIKRNVLNRLILSTQFFLAQCHVIYTNTHKHTHSLSLSLSLSHTHTHTMSCTFVNAVRPEYLLVLVIVEFLSKMKHYWPGRQKWKFPRQFVRLDFSHGRR
jgi:hypothetical protein